MLGQFIAQVSQPGAGIKNQKMVAAANFQRRGITAVARGFWPGTGDAAADAPKFGNYILE